MKWVFHLAATYLFVICQTFAQTSDSLRYKIQQIVSTKKATVGVSIIANDGKDTISLNGDKHCPLQSVFKFHIALTVLSQIDAGKLTLDQKVEIRGKELLPNFWSPLRDANPQGGSFTIARLIQYSVSQSDNVACDVLMRLIGKPQTVEAYCKKNNIHDIAIAFNEEDMQSSWDNMFQNWTTPKAASEILRKFYEKKNKLLSKKNHTFIWKTMQETTTGEKRLKGLLPKQTVVMHKTGTSGTNKEELTPATNDIGIIFLPNGKHFIISVFVTDSKENDETNEKIIAEIAKITFEHFLSQK